jgi:membrane-associated protease RseP (regulator of RpoE activity)
LEADGYKRFESYYGVINLVRTRRFQAIMDRLGSSRISKPVGWLLLYAMPVAAGLGFFLFLSEGGILLSPRGVAVATYIRSLSPLANLGLPGINPYLPIVDGWIALVIAMIIHEGAHGVVARSLGLPVKASGLLFFFVLPIGAFVDVDETAIRTSRPSNSGRVLAAGAGINLLAALLCLTLLVGVVSTMTPASQRGIGVVVAANSPLSKAGIQTYDYILAVNGTPLNDTSAIATSSWYKINNTVTVTVWRDGATFNRSVTLSYQTLMNTSSGKTFESPFLGVSVQGNPGTQSAANLHNLLNSYAGAFFSRPFVYLCIPTLPNCQSGVPFSDTMSPFYKSSLGSGLTPLANLLYWMFFLNFNLAIFNALPIYPLDGGQAFMVGLKALGKGKLSETTLMRLTSVATLAVLALVLGVLVGPYFF